VARVSATACSIGVASNVCAMTSTRRQRPDPDIGGPLNECRRRSAAAIHQP
jgi:hypothetical protein